mmetsp:Transcript_6609/g.20102  ORF Transcript_6609/g.20102 Transcript_6609/m.20102 type:complete len:301 (-) Transcript_6609:297-1199(-)
MHPSEPSIILTASCDLCLTSGTNASGPWVCSVILGQVHAYPMLHYFEEGCNVCGSLIEECNPNDIDLVGGLFLKRMRHGPFVERAIENIWSDRANVYFGLLRSVGFEVPLGWDFVDMAVCALDYPLQLVAFNTYDTVNRLFTINSERTDIQWSDWSCNETWAVDATRIFAEIEKPPETLTESFFECTRKRFPAAIDALGVAYGNAELLAIIALGLILRQLVRALFKCSPDFFHNRTLVTDGCVQDTTIELALARSLRSSGSSSSRAHCMRREGKVPRAVRQPQTRPTEIVVLKCRPDSLE